MYIDESGVILLASGSLHTIPGLSVPMLDTRVLSHQISSASFPSMCASVHFPSLSQSMQTHVPNLPHMKPCVSHSTPSHLCEESLAPSPPWPPPLPTFHARRDLITQKLVQRRIVCFYGISARTAVNLGLLLQPPLGPVQAVEGLSPPQPSLLHLCPASWASTSAQDHRVLLGTHLNGKAGEVLSVKR